MWEVDPETRRKVSYTLSLLLLLAAAAVAAQNSLSLTRSSQSLIVAARVRSWSSSVNEKETTHVVTVGHLPPNGCALLTLPPFPSSNR